MSHGRTSVRRVLIAAFMTLTMPAVDARQIDSAQSAQAKPSTPNPCRPANNLSRKEAVVRGGYVGRDAKVIYTFSIERDADPVQVTAFKTAVDKWNKWSHKTRMMLVEAPRGWRPDVKFGKGPEEAKIYCAKQEPDESSVRYFGPQMALVAEDPQRAALTYAHEIGHVFGLDHSNDSDLMNEHRQSKDCKAAAENLKDISAKDAQRARECAFAAHYPHRYRRPPK